MTKRQLTAAMLGILTLAFALNVRGLAYQSLWRDEVDTLLFASGPMKEQLGRFLQPGQNGPLYFLVLGPWLKVAGETEFALRFSSTLAAVLVVALVYRLGRRLFPRHPLVGLVGALLAATSPYLVWYGQEGKMYALVTALVLVAVDAYLTALKEGGWHRWLIFVLSTSAALYVHLVSALMIPALALMFLLRGRDSMRQAWKPWLASMVVLTIPYLPLLVWQWPMLLQGGESGYRFVGLHEMVSSLLGSFSLGVLQHPEPWLMVPFVGLLLSIGLWLVSDRRERSSIGTLLLWLLVPVLGFFMVTFARPMFTARYLIFVVPAYMLLLAYALVRIGQRSRLIGGLLLLAVVLVSGWGLGLQGTTPLKADFRSAAQYVASRFNPSDLVLFQIPHGRHSFAYYYEPQAQAPVPTSRLDGLRLLVPYVAGGGSQPFQWADGLYTNGGMPVEEVGWRMAEIADDKQVLWLVVTEQGLWDERGLVMDWLEEHYLQESRADFVRVSVFRYLGP